ncbi:lysine-2,3-aminomutase-like protein [Aestuariivirga litoralis]|uniref:lysine-2,3-aminomutase-like protein n=1 Tax=Aestuariivirga litoralis TaxID=2650924 RepID=UPI0018C7880B|nr:lysine-2,3-aminomutase-like protein [Aestuariivirga litoralis]MBG1232106.1 lysine-2,3-aminomutase-like protein [Aestuariivirga litoralis]
MSKAATSARALAGLGLVTADEAARLAAVEDKFSTRLSPEVLRQIKTASLDDPIFRQYVPSREELDVREDELADPIGDVPHQKVKGIIHRYRDRLLLTPTHTCQVYCRFCFRREKVGSAANLSKAELEAAYAYIAVHSEVNEVILTGGDPLVLSDRRLAEIIGRISAIPHVSVIRIHSRVPLVEPARITRDLLKALKTRCALFMLIHVNHAAELSKPVCAGLARLNKAGIPLLSQSVLLKGVNNDAEVLATLFRALIANRVKPYYLHHLDKAEGTSHFRVSIAEGQALMRQLRGKLSGLAQPTYVLDIPGGFGKVPIGPVSLNQKAPGQYEIADPEGRRHRYQE